MDELVKIEKSPTSGEPIVNARNLHKGLEVKMNFSHWIRPLIEKWGFIENQDYASYRYDIYGNLLNNVGQAKKSQPDIQEVRTQKIEYILTLNCAKEIAMVQNNAKGKEIRQFFIRREKELQKLKLQAIQSTQTNIKNLTIAETAKILNTSSHKLNQLLRLNKYFKPNNKPYEKYVCQGLFTYELYNSRYSAKQLKVTGNKGFPAIQQLLSGNKIISQPIQPAPIMSVNQSLLIYKIDESRFKELEKVNLITSNALQVFINHTLYCKSGSKNLPQENEIFMAQLKRFSVELEKINSIKSIENL